MAECSVIASSPTKYTGLRLCLKLSTSWPGGARRMRFRSRLWCTQVTDRSSVAPADITHVRSAEAVRLHPSGAIGAVILQQVAGDLTYTTHLYWIEGLACDSPKVRPSPVDNVVDLVWSHEGSRVCYAHKSPNGVELVVAAWVDDTRLGASEFAICLSTFPEGLCLDAAGMCLCFAMHVPPRRALLGSLASEPGCRVIQGVVPFKTELRGYREGGYRQLFEVRRNASGTWTLRQVTPGPHDHLMPAIDPRGRRAACVRQSPGADQFFGNQCIIVVDLETGEETTIAEPGGPCWFPAWSPAGDQLAWLSHDGHLGAGEGTDLRIWSHDGAKCAQHELTLRRSIEDVLLDDVTPVPGTGARPIAWDQAGEGILCLITDGGSTGLYRIPLTTGCTQQPIGVMIGPRRVFAFAYAAGRILAAVADPTDPCRIVEVLGASEREVFAPNSEWLSQQYLSKPRRFLFSGANGAAIEGWIVPPIGRAVEGAPCVVQINRGRFG